MRMMGEEEEDGEMEHVGAGTDVAGGLDVLRRGGEGRGTAYRT